MNLSETTFVTRAGRGRRRARAHLHAVQELPFAGHPSVGTACELVRLGAVHAEEPVTRVVLELDVGPDPRGGRGRGRRAAWPPPCIRAHPSSATPSRAPRSPPCSASTKTRSHPELRARCRSAPASRTRSSRCVSQRSLAHVQLDLDFLPAFERDHAEVYPCAFTGRDDPWMEARGLFPFAGIPEDPATGSAAGPLAAFMARARPSLGGRAPRRPAGPARRPPEPPRGLGAGTRRRSTTCASAGPCSRPPRRAGPPGLIESGT